MVTMPKPQKASTNIQRTHGGMLALHTQGELGKHLRSIQTVYVQVWQSFLTNKGFVPAKRANRILICIPQAMTRNVSQM